MLNEVFKPYIDIFLLSGLFLLFYVSFEFVVNNGRAHN
ncbi:hypothetical protein VME0621_03248 [Vibrio mediterranei]|nr:hypothetical protein VME0621_03248 [Vibrio mediterranei]